MVVGCERARHTLPIEYVYGFERNAKCTNSSKMQNAVHAIEFHFQFKIFFGGPTTTTTTTTNSSEKEKSRSHEY